MLLDERNPLSDVSTVHMSYTMNAYLSRVCTVDTKYDSFFVALITRGA